MIVINSSHTLFILPDTTEYTLVRFFTTVYYVASGKCNECNKQFSQGGNLTTCKSIHTGETPYKCSEYNKQLSQQSN